MIKVNGYLPHPLKKGFAVINPILFIIPTIHHKNITLVIEAYESMEDLEAGKKIGNEQYSDIAPIPFKVWLGTADGDQAPSKTFVSFSEVTRAQSVDGNEVVTKTTIGVTLNGEQVEVKKQVNSEEPTIYYSLQELDVRQADNVSTNVSDKLLRWCSEVVIEKMQVAYPDEIQAGNLTFEIINLSE